MDTYKLGDRVARVSVSKGEDIGYGVVVEGARKDGKVGVAWDKRGGFVFPNLPSEIRKTGERDVATATDLAARLKRFREETRARIRNG